MTIRKLIIISGILITTVATSAFGQDKEKCEKHVATIINAINKKTARPIESFLAKDFKISGYTGEIGRIILNQLIPQLDETVLKYDLLDPEAKFTGTLRYEITYQKLGKKTAFFVFNAENQLLEMEIVQTTVSVGTKLPEN